MSEIPDYIAKCRRNWPKHARSLRVLFCVLGCLGLICPLVVTTFADQLKPFWVRIVTLVGTSAIGVLYAFDIPGKANRFRQAYRVLETALIRFEHGDNPAFTKVLDAYDSGEAKIGDVHFNQDAAEKRMNKLLSELDQHASESGGISRKGNEAEES